MRTVSIFPLTCTAADSPFVVGLSSLNRARERVAKSSLALATEKAVEDFSTYALEMSQIRRNHEAVRLGASESCRIHSPSNSGATRCESRHGRNIPDQ